MKAAVEHLGETFALSRRRACGLIGLAASTFRYEPKSSDEDLRRQLIELAQERPRFGYRRLHALLRGRVWKPIISLSGAFTGKPD